MDGHNYTLIEGRYYEAVYKKNDVPFMDNDNTYVGFAKSSKVLQVVSRNGQPYDTSGGLYGAIGIREISRERALGIKMSNENALYLLRRDE